jgi:rRNA-processing protein FCF1
VEEQRSLFGRNVLVVSKEEKLKVVLDANFLFVPIQFRLDIFEEMAILLNQSFDPILLSSTRNELQGLVESDSPKERKEALFALKLAEKCRIIPVEKSVGETYDDVIVRVAAEWKSPVATNDRELRRRVRTLGLPVIFLRQKRRLILEGAV